MTAPARWGHGGAPEGRRPRQKTCWATLTLVKAHAVVTWGEEEERSEDNRDSQLPRHTAQGHGLVLRRALLQQSRCRHSRGLPWNPWRHPARPERSEFKVTP